MIIDLNRVLYGAEQNSFQIDFCWMALFLLRFGIIFFGIALVVSLYKRALAFEKEFMPMDPDKLQFQETVDEMSTHVNEIYKHIMN